VKSNISEQTKYLQSKFTIIHPENYKMSPLRGGTLVGLVKKYPKNGGVRKANSFALALAKLSIQVIAWCYNNHTCEDPCRFTSMNRKL
jgi:hypothetical protein